MSLIRLENVSLARQGKTLLSGLNWTVEKGQTWAILGLNGAGKSTLLRLLTAESSTRHMGIRSCKKPRIC